MWSSCSTRATPFPSSRYRKERTGGLNEDVIRQVQARVKLMRDLADRKQTILKSIDGQGKLTAELRDAILAADNPKRLEDLYLPYKPKKKTLASEARDKGLEPLAWRCGTATPRSPTSPRCCRRWSTRRRA